MWNEKIFDDYAAAMAFKKQLDTVCCGVTTDFCIVENGYCVQWKKAGLVIN